MIFSLRKYVFCTLPKGREVLYSSRDHSCFPSAFLLLSIGNGSIGVEKTSVAFGFTPFLGVTDVLRALKVSRF